MDDIGSPRRTKDIISKHGFTFKKSLGQNFLIDANILSNIVAAAELDSSKGALEVGPGAGALTQRLAHTAGKVIAVEIDQRLLPILAETLAEAPNTEVVHGDILELDLHKHFDNWFADVDKVSVVANLPYYVTTPIIMKLLESQLPLEHIVIMIQKEVADRIAASPGTKAYGSLSVAVQYYCVPKLVCIVPHTVFIPPPNVDSAVLRLTLRDKPAVEVPNEEQFFKLVQASFAQRRKTLGNNLSSAFGKERRAEIAPLLASVELDAGRRGETLTLEEFARMSRLFVEKDWLL